MPAADASRQIVEVGGARVLQHYVADDGGLCLNFCLVIQLIIAGFIVFFSNIAGKGDKEIVKFNN